MRNVARPSTAATLQLLQRICDHWFVCKEQTGCHGYDKARFLRDATAVFKLGTLKHTTYIQGGSNMTGTDLCVNKLHCAAAVRP